MAYYLGLDNGGTVTKAAIFDSTGRSLAMARVETEVQITGPGFAERDMEQMWQANCTVIRSALEQAKLSPEEIACVTCCGHGKGPRPVCPQKQDKRLPRLKAGAA